MTARPPHLDATALTRALGRSRLPRALSLEGRVALIGDAATALLTGRKPSREAALFLGGALEAWLGNGGNLSRDYLKVVRARSHRTASRIWQEIQSQTSAHQDEGEDPPADE